MPTAVSPRTVFAWDWADFLKGATATNGESASAFFLVERNVG